jgi:hypothetical protein
LDREIMTEQASSPLPHETTDLAAIWANARRMHPIYAEMAREFAIEVTECQDLEAGAETPGRESVEQAQQWLNAVDEKIQVHQLRQFLQTSSRADEECLVDIVQHLLRKNPRTDSLRDKIDFLLVQYFSQITPTDLKDDDADLECVAQGLEPVLGEVEIKAPVWLNSLHRVLDSARRCQSLNELLHGGVLEQGRKAKAQAGELFYMPVALVAFTRFGYLMRRVFFRLMHEDLNHVLEGLTELEEKGVENIDCRRAQFSAEEPVIRLRMICQSWKVMFQAEYSSGQPLRMLVDLRASIDAALGRDSAAAKGAALPAKAPAAKQAASASVTPKNAARVKKAVASAGASVSFGAAQKVASAENPKAPKAAADEVPEFEISTEAPQWNPNSES